MLTRRTPPFPDLCLQKAKGTWSPTPEALKSIFQAKKFVTLDGASEAQGDLKSVVLHNMKYAPKRPTSAPIPVAHALPHPTGSST